MHRDQTAQPVELHVPAQGSFEDAFADMKESILKGNGHEVGTTANPIESK